MPIDLLLATLFLHAIASTSGSTDPAVVAKAEALLRTADEKLTAANSLHAVYTEVDAYPGQYRDLRQIGTLDVARPGKIQLRIVRARRVKATDPWKDSGNTTLSVSDGTNAYAVFFHSYSTQVRSLRPAIAPKLGEAPLLAGFFGGSISPAALLEKANADGKLSSATVDGSTVEFKAGSVDRTIELGKDGAVRRLTVRDEATGASKTWTIDSISFNSPLSAAAFHYDPPKDALPYPAGEASETVSEGEIAPDFADVSSKGETVRLSDYRGHVVLLEFWATWCWPCNQSIPETQRLARAHAGDGVKTLLVSIKDNQKGFDAWVAKHPQYRDLTFAFDDPVHGSAYEAFQHPTNPTLYVIGKDGKVVDRFVGYTGPNPEVEKAIQAALGR